MTRLFRQDFSTLILSRALGERSGALDRGSEMALPPRARVRCVDPSADSLSDSATVRILASGGGYLAR